MIEVDLNWLEEMFKSRTKLYDVSKLTSVDDVTLAVSDGDNYVSKIYRLSLSALSSSGKQITYSLILKRKIEINLDNEELTKKMEHAFNSEYQVYANTLVKVEKYLLKNGTTLWADCLGSIPNKDIYFEDLKASGYCLADRMEGLDLDHCHLVFRSLAEFHAASYMAISNGEIDTSPYRKYLMLRASSDTKKAKSNAYALMVDVIRKEWEPEWKSIADRLETVCQTLPDMVLELDQLNESNINVFNHGDTWVNNFMFKYNSKGQPISLKFVDFQITHYNSFVFDICYLLGTSVDPDLKKKHLNTWIDTYCRTFSNCLEEHGCHLPSPTPDMVRQELSRVAPFQLNCCLRIRPLIMIPSEDSVPISEVLSDTGLNSRKRRLYTNPILTSVMKKGLPDLITNVESVMKNCKYN